MHVSWKDPSIAVLAQQLSDCLGKYPVLVLDADGYPLVPVTKPARWWVQSGRHILVIDWLWTA